MSKTVEFIQYHQPPLNSGSYEITVKQEVDAGAGKEEFPRTQEFAVSGHRYTPLTARDIFAVYPPAGSLGNYSNIIPHITFNRSTLPWERSIDKNDSDLTWLALLIFRESEKPEVQTITLEELKNTDPSIAKFPEWSEEPGEQNSDEILVIDVPRSVLEEILPKRADLLYLGHVRKTKDDQDTSTSTEKATVIANRLPKPGETTTVHLVSLENRYPEEGDFDYQGATVDNSIRLISLKSWSFTCIKLPKTFSDTLTRLDRKYSSLRLPRLKNGNGNKEAEKYLSMGYIPLPHGMRQGEKTISWYHSPLSPGKNPGNLKQSVEAADALVRYESSNGLFDISYAAAWELGRLLTLKNQSIAVQLYNWKRANSPAWKRANSSTLQEMWEKAKRLPLASKTIPEEEEMPEAIATWFRNLELLKGIPFNYLVPDERLLPLESIRFFWLDSYWVDCLQDGAFSIGRAIKADATSDQQILQQFRGSLRTIANEDNPNEDKKITGILLRSEAVSGWPGLLVDGYPTNLGNNRSIQSFSPDDEPLNLLRMERLSENVLICLFAGEVKTVDIHLQPETMHFGIYLDNECVVKYKKKLRNPDNGDQQITVPCHNFELGVINIAQFATDINNALRNGENGFTSAQFGLEMIEGVQKVRFCQS
ncbi:MAG: hypothetical protein F6K58_20010 [Symploca sp. SIO2E9]|nr:hypothetical protein [Symploca sp. SIO2E9]